MLPLQTFTELNDILSINLDFLPFHPKASHPNSVPSIHPQYTIVLVYSHATQGTMSNSWACHFKQNRKSTLLTPCHRYECFAIEIVLNLFCCKNFIRFCCYVSYVFLGCFLGLFYFVGNHNKPSFATVTGPGDNPINNPFAVVQLSHRNSARKHRSNQKFSTNVPGKHWHITIPADPFWVDDFPWRVIETTTKKTLNLDLLKMLRTSETCITVLSQMVVNSWFTMVQSKKITLDNSPRLVMVDYNPYITG